jgi:hypothetical protein
VGSGCAGGELVAQGRLGGCDRKSDGLRMTDDTPRVHIRSSFLLQNSRLIFPWRLRLVDHDHIDWRLSSFELQPELLL